MEVSSITHCTACFAFKSVKQCFLIPTTLILLINILQTIDIYHISFPNDARGIKLLVFGILILETLQVCLGAADIYYWFGAGYGNMIRLGRTYLSPFDTPLMGSLTSFTIQIFFCYRIRVLRKEFWPLCILIGTISTTQLYGGISGGIRGYLNKDFSSRDLHVEDAFLWLIGNAVADFLIAVTMIFLLLKSRTQEHKFTNDVISRLVRLIMETNSLTAGVAVFSVILFVAFPNANYFICPTLVIGKLYSNTLLVTFNNRIFLSNRHNDDRGISALQARPGPTPRRHSQIINQTLGAESYKIGTLTRDCVMEASMHSSRGTV